MANTEASSASLRIGQNVRRIRQERGLTLAEFSAALEQGGHRLSEAPLSRLETGGRVVDADDLVALATALDVPITELLADPTESVDREVYASMHAMEEAHQRRVEVVKAAQADVDRAVMFFLAAVSRRADDLESLREVLELEGAREMGRHHWPDQLEGDIHRLLSAMGSGS